MRELQLVEAGGDVFIEVVLIEDPVSRGFPFRPFHHYVGRESWAIVPKLFGSSAEALVEEMDDWRARSIVA